MSKLLAEQRIERCHVQLMKHKNFALFSGLFMIGKVSVDDKTPTACTNGLDVRYGRAFVDRLNDKQLAFLILHENMHKAYRHLVVWEKLNKKNSTLANMACDYVINLQIRDYDPNQYDTEMPTDDDGEVMGLIDEKYRGMDAHEVFLLLEKEKGSDYGKGKNKIKVMMAGDDDGDGYGDDDGDGTPDGFDDHDWDGAQELSKDEQDEVAKEIEQALRQGSILVGKMGGNVDRNIGEMLTPKIDWKEALRDFVKSMTQGKDQSSWRRLHKRYLAADLIMPSSYSEKVGGIAIAIDTSGSIGSEELNQFLSEVKSICEEVSPEVIDLLYWDTHVASRETYTENELAGLTESTKPAGGGGTEPACVPKYMNKHNIKPECLIMLTDGYIGAQDPSNWTLSTPVLWCIKGNSRFSSADAPVGKIVHVQ
jgi:predicted metal-dependent peptidase